LKPASEGLRVHRIFISGEDCKHVVADGALKAVQVHAWALWFDADKHHMGPALRAGGALKWSRRNVG
jgi:hypothetical protein